MANTTTGRNGKWILLTIVLIVLFFAGISYFASTDVSNTQSQTPPPAGGPTTTQSSVPLDEQKQIHTWIKENKLNQYGDPVNTVYAGGTPLFNESTGEYKNKYDHIVENHPDRPWNK